MNRGIQDEMFIRNALSIATDEDGRFIANQSYFNNSADEKIDILVHSALITTVAIYVQHEYLEESTIEEVLLVDTWGKARNFIDKYQDYIDMSGKNDRREG